MRYTLLIALVLLAGCEQNISHEAIQDAYSACGNHDGLASLTVDSDSAAAYCENGHKYVVPKTQHKKPKKDADKK